VGFYVLGLGAIPSRLVVAHQGVHSVRLLPGVHSGVSELVGLVQQHIALVDGRVQALTVIIGVLFDGLQHGVLAHRGELAAALHLARVHGQDLLSRSLETAAALVNHLAMVRLVLFGRTNLRDLEVEVSIIWVFDGGVSPLVTAGDAADSRGIHAQIQLAKVRRLVVRVLIGPVHVLIGNVLHGPLPATAGNGSEPRVLD